MTRNNAIPLARIRVNFEESTDVMSVEMVYVEPTVLIAGIGAWKLLLNVNGDALEATTDTMK